MSTVLIVIPTYNEVDNISNLIKSLKEVLIAYGYSYHILIVDDNSPDGTARIVENISRSDRHVHLLIRRGKLGLGSAYIDGFTWALSNLNFDILVQMDADFSHPPSDLARLVKAVVNGYDVAVASRYVKQGSLSKWPIYRILISRVANLLAHKLLGINVNDITSGFKAMRRDIVQELLKHHFNSSGYSYQVKCLAIFKDMAIKITEVPFVFESRLVGKPKLSVIEIFRFAIFLLKFSLSSLKRR